MNNVFPVNELRSRYSIGKQADINRRKYLGITPQKVEGKYYVSQDELGLLDSLDQFLKTPGAKMADFAPPKNEEIIQQPLNLEASLITEEDSSLVEIEQDRPEDWLMYVEAIARAIRPPNPIQHWEKLKWAADEGILLSTKEIYQLLGTKPNLAPGHTSWQRGSFIFKKAGKMGSSMSWQIIHNKNVN